jgi:hypothetical protein
MNMLLSTATDIAAHVGLGKARAYWSTTADNIAR